MISSPVTVSVDLPQPRDEVFAFLDVMANHESFTDHMLVDWRVSGPATGIGSKARVTSKVGGITDDVDIEVIEADPGYRIKERNIAANGKRVGTGTYVLSDLPNGGTHVEFTYEFERVPGYERPLLPLMRRILRRGNGRAMERLAEVLRTRSPEPLPTR
ncbi:MAG TPA: SRPBCC family protein [Solirubrobacter sp.]|nr:SRPBCC family protein [Solirubrobacter sp.]